jgi:uncharacterized protein YjbI with pentapeptide repeats
MVDRMSHLRNFLSKVRKQLPLILLLIALVLWTRWVYNFGWSGFGSYIDSDGKVVPAKTLWDWLQLLIVPLILAGGGLWLNATIQQIERERAERRAEADQKIANERLEEQTLQTYLDRMSQLLLGGHFDNPPTWDRASSVARAQTLTTLRGLSGQRRVTILQFLYESKLIMGDTPPVVLRDANFVKIVFQNEELIEAQLAGVHLSGAALGLTHLERANLSNAWLNSVSLADVHLEGANLENAILYEANLNGTHLEGANLRGATITDEQLEKAILDEKTILPNGSHYKPAH